jgi:hypothetical protein
MRSYVSLYALVGLFICVRRSLYMLVLLNDVQKHMLLNRQ